MVVETRAPAFRYDNSALLKSGPDLMCSSGAVQFVDDSPLEESGFELLVPHVDAGLFGRNGTEITRVSRTI
jgi:hypothetical protein